LTVLRCSRTQRSRTRELVGSLPPAVSAPATTVRRHPSRRRLSRAPPVDPPPQAAAIDPQPPPPATMPAPPQPAPNSPTGGDSQAGLDSQAAEGSPQDSVPVSPPQQQAPTTDPDEPPDCSHHWSRLCLRMIGRRAQYRTLLASSGPRATSRGNDPVRRDRHTVYVPSHTTHTTPHHLRCSHPDQGTLLM